MTLHLELLTSELADALMVRNDRNCKDVAETPRSPADKQVPVEAPVAEAPAGTWAY
ncbi:MAG: hypothetical protein JNL04_12825 [Rhodospirillaceae bacterium]|nr:hypothetical protein [Rhodospirillaceae bacterium]